MGRVFCLSFVLSICAFACAPTAYCDGTLSAGSEASCSEGFPILTGQGATVYGPNGSYVVGADDNKKSRVQGGSGAGGVTSSAHKVLCQVKNYSWVTKHAKSVSNVQHQNDTTSHINDSVNTRTMDKTK